MGTAGPVPCCQEEPRPSADWTGPAGYLRLSAAYDDAAELAERRGWPVRRLDTHHLAPTSRPDDVALALAELLDLPQFIAPGATGGG